MKKARTPWLERVKKKFKTGDRVIFNHYEGTVTEIYEFYILVKFDIGYRQCFGYHAIYEDVLKAC
ncbi:MAG: hypothetical protein LIO87_02655 [Eubacterium sp.]|nr:hypothetical protein [Eubacterium sp.]